MFRFYTEMVWSSRKGRPERIGKGKSGLGITGPGLAMKHLRQVFAGTLLPEALPSPWTPT